MKNYFFTLLVLALTARLASAQIYFPPTTGSQWDTVSPASLGWCVSELDTLSDYVEARHSKSFIILHKGKIAFEKYYNGHSRDSSWYWASAGKSLVAFLTGMAQEQNLLDIHDQTSDYLGTGWTVAPPAKENGITIQQQLQMTTGLDFNVADQNCLADTCLKYIHDAGTHWYYHNAPYRLLQDVLEAATSKNLNVYTYQSLTPSTGIKGLWLAYIFFSDARSMARFGLLNLNRGVWNGTPVLADTAYFNAMTSPSQNLNPAYGYLWWLNGGNFFKQPGFDVIFSGSIIPTAPADLYMAAGANDQRIYIVPSLDLVVVRQGDAAYTSQAALSQFDSDLWDLLGNLVCTKVGLAEHRTEQLQVFPNPVKGQLNFKRPVSGAFKLSTLAGQPVMNGLLKEESCLDLSHLPIGIYLFSLNGATIKIVKN